MYTLRKSLMLLAIICLVSCQKTGIHRNDVQELSFSRPSTLKLTKGQTEMTKGINDFTYKIFKETLTDKDIFISPFSISIALSMLTTGADGDTEQQLLSALGFEGKTTEDLDEYYSAVIKNMTSSDPETTLNIANAIWSRKDISLQSQYVSDCKKYFDSVAESVDFTDPSTLQKINDWTKEKTNGKIEKLIEALSSRTSAILTNALYFKATWALKFWRSGKRMVAKAKTAYFEGDGYTAVLLPYGNGTFAMRIIQPDKDKQPEDVISRLDELSEMSGETAIVSLNIPVFSFSYENHLNDALKNLGIKDAFLEEKADFSKMSFDKLYLGDVLHKTFIDVNENGTEAAAATAVSMFGNAVPPREVEFKVERDFIFEIIDRSSGITIFIGLHKM